MIRFLHFILLIYTANFFGQPGCTDPLANNFDVLATENDGSCTYDQTTIIPELIQGDLPNILNEQSGMIYFNDQYWIVNDSGNNPEIIIWDASSQTIVDTIQFQNIDNIDWESLEQDETYIYIGDFGNNVGNRTDLRILRLAKSELLGPTPELIVPDTIAFHYPEQTDFTDQLNGHNFDCEAFIVWQDQFYLFTKEWVSNITSIYKVPIQVGNHEAELLGFLPVQGLVTGASFDSTNNVIMLLGYQLDTAFLPFIYMMWDFPSNNFSLGNRRKIDLDWSNYKTETITHVSENCWYIGSEYWEIGPIGFQNQLRKIDVSEFLSGTTGWPDIQITGQVVIYPNPSSGFIYIPDNTELIRVLTIEGRQADFQYSHQGIILKGGIYLVELKTDQGRMVQSIVVQD